MTAAVVAVLLAGAAGLLLPGTDPAARLRLLAAPPPAGAPAASPGAALPLAPQWLPRLLVAGAVAALVTSRGLSAAVLLVLAVAVAAPAGRRRRELEQARIAAARHLPRAADLLATCLQAGSPLPTALAVVAEAVGGPVGARLGAVGAVVASGADLPRASAAPVEPVDRLVEALARAARTGAPLAQVVRELAADERDRGRWLATERARSAAVRAVGPLAACYLPAFVLVGVVPVVAGVLRSVLAGW